jgi:hypothetical protein
VVEVLASEARLSKEWHFGWYASFVGFDFVAEPISECHYNKKKSIICNIFGSTSVGFLFYRVYSIISL